MSTECSGCGQQDPDNLTECPLCGGDKCDNCDEGDDVDCLNCDALGDFDGIDGIDGIDDSWDA